MGTAYTEKLLGLKVMNKLFYLLVFLVFAGCGDSAPLGAPPTLENGSPAPDFSVKLLDGKDVTLESFKGKPLVMTYMASWCPCSHDSAPVFINAYGDYHPKGVEFIMLGIQDSESKFDKFVKKEGFPYPAGYDEGDRIARRYGVSAPPTTFFIDSSGKVISSFYGKIVEKEKLAAWIDQIMPKEPENAPR